MGLAVTNSDGNSHPVGESHLRLCPSPYPGHGWPIQLSDGFVHLQVVSPDFRAHGVHQREPKQDDIGLFHGLTWGRQSGSPRTPAGNNWKTDCLFTHTGDKPDSHGIINLDQQTPHGQGKAAELQAGQLIAALLKAHQNGSLRFVKAGHRHSPNTVAPRRESPKLWVQRNSPHDPAHPAPNCEKGDTELHFHQNQPLHLQSTRGCWKGNAWHLTLKGRPSCLL